MELSRLDRNRMFWEAVLDRVSLAPGMKASPAPKRATCRISVPGPRPGDSGLWFNCYRQAPRSIGCALTFHANKEDAKRIFFRLYALDPAELERSFGGGCTTWVNSVGKERIGFSAKRWPTPLHPGTRNFDEAVEWMRTHVDLLITRLYPRLREELAAGM